MSTKRNQVTTYVDAATLKWIRAQALKNQWTVSHFLAILISEASRPPPVAVLPRPAPYVPPPPSWPPEPQHVRPAPNPIDSEPMRIMKERALGTGDFGSVEEHKEFLHKSLRFCAITRAEHDAKIAELDGGPETI